MSSDMFGWDLTYKSVEKDITKKEEVLVAFIHWFLVKRGFRCIGVGEEKTLVGNEIGSELLPVGWNVNENYTLRYLFQKDLYILHCILSDDGNLLFNLMKASDLSVSNVAIHNIEKTVIATTGDINQMIPTYKDLMHIILRDLVEAFPYRGTRCSETQTACEHGAFPSCRCSDILKLKNNPWLNQPSTNCSMPSSSSKNQQPPRHPLSEDPLRVPPRMPPHAGVDPDWNSRDPFSIGRSDLDPLGQAGGGMIFNPFGPNPGGPMNPGLGIPGGLPRGAIPPGARFDPMGPIGGFGPLRRRPPPDADHFPPPGYEDMFM